MKQERNDPIAYYAGKNLCNLLFLPSLVPLLLLPLFILFCSCSSKNSTSPHPDESDQKLPAEAYVYGGSRQKMPASLVKQCLAPKVFSIFSLQELFGTREYPQGEADDATIMEKTIFQGNLSPLVHHLRYQRDYVANFYQFDFRHRYILAVLGEQIEAYSKLPATLRQKLDIVVLCLKGYLDLDDYLKSLKAPETSSASTPEELRSQEKHIRETMLFYANALTYIGRTKHLAEENEKHIQSLAFDQQRSQQLAKEISTLSYPSRIFEDTEEKMFQDIVEKTLTEIRSGTIDPSAPVDLSYNSFWVQNQLRLVHPIRYDQLNTLGDFIGMLICQPEKHISLEKRQELANYLYHSGAKETLITLFCKDRFSGYEDYAFAALGTELVKQGFMTFFPISNYFTQLPLSKELLLAGYPMPTEVLAQAANSNNLENARLLLLAGAPTVPKSSQNTYHSPNSSILAIPIRYGYWEMEKLLLEYGANPKESLPSGQSLESLRPYGEYWNAFLTKNYDRQKEILDAGLDVNSPWEFYNTFLDKAIDAQDTEAMRLLLEHGASLEKKTYLDDTYQKHFHEGFRLLLEHGAEKEEKELVYSILQHYSFTPNWEEQKQYFKEILAKFTPEELSPFTFPRRKDLPATTFPNYVLSISDRDTSPAQKHEVLLLLKEKGIPIIAPQKEKYTSLFYSLLKDFSNESPCLNTRMEKLLDFLIAQGEDVNCAAFPKEDSEGNTKLEMTGILTYMAREKYKTPGLVGYFLDHGARTDIKDETGKTCMDYLAELEDKSAWQALYAPEEFQKARELYRTKIYVEFHNVEEFFANPSYRHDPVQIASEGLKDDQLALSFPYWLDKFRASVLSREKDSRDTYTLEYAIYQPLYFHASIHVIRLPESAETDSWEKVVQEQWQNRQKDLEKKSSILEIEDLQFSPLSAPKKLAKSGIQYKENEASFVKLDWYNSNCARATLLKKHYFYTLHHGNVLEIEVFAREKKACLQLEEVWELFLQTIDSQLFAKSAIQQ